MRYLVALLFVLLLAGCVANSPRQMQAIPPAEPLSDFSGRPAFETADKWSFTQAVFHYEAGGNNRYHTIPVGDYLLEGLVSAAGQFPDVTGIRLESFSNTSRMKVGLLGRHLVSMHIKISYKEGGHEQQVSLDSDETDVGPYYSGDWSVIPFTSAGTTDDTIFHEQIRPMLDEAVKIFAAHLAKGQAD